MADVPCVTIKGATNSYAFTPPIACEYDCVVLNPYLFDLSVGEEKHSMLVRLRRFSQDRLQVLVPLIARVTLTDLNLKQQQTCK